MAKSPPKSDTRQARLADALRENLKRRKASAQGTKAGKSPQTRIGKSDPDAAGDQRPNPAAKPF